MATRRVVSCSFALAIALPIGCAAAPPDGELDSRGSIALELGSADFALQSLHYVISNGETTVAGDVDVLSASAFAAIGGIPSGAHYALTLVATEAGGTGVTCAGSSLSFDVRPGGTAAVSLELVCRKPPIGGILVHATTNECPTITSVSADPPHCSNGASSVGLHVAARDPDDGPRPLGYVWSNGLEGADPTLTCAGAGRSSFTVTVSDGDPAPGCDHTFGVTVLCDTCPMP